MTRLVNVVTHRTLLVRKWRKRLPESLHMRLEVPAEIPEAHEDEVACVARTTDPDGTVNEFFAYGDSFVAPVSGTVQGEDIAAYFAGRLAHGRRPACAELRTGDDTWQAADLRGQPDDTVREVVSDNCEATAAAARREVAAHVIVDGILWKPTGEPFWAVSRRVGREPPVLAAAVGDVDRLVAGFRIDRAAEADAYIRSLSKHMSRRYAGKPTRAELHGIKLSRDDRLHAAILLGDRIVDMLIKGWLRLMPREAILQWADLREEVAAGTDADAIVRRAERLVEAMVSLDLNRNGVADRDSAMQGLFDVLTRWTAYEGGSPVALDDSENAALAALGAA